MSAKTTTEYFCDRCGDSLGDKEPSKKLTVKAALEGEWAMEFSRDWKDFCPSCKSDVIKFFTHAKA